MRLSCASIGEFLHRAFGNRDGAIVPAGRLHLVGWLAVLGLCLWVCAGCTRHESETKATPAVEALPVRVHGPTRQDITERVRGESALRPRTHVLVLAKQRGAISALDAAVGDHVVKGARLARIHNDQVGLEMQQARHVLEAREQDVASSRPLYDKGLMSRDAFQKLALARDHARNALARLRARAADQSVRAPIDGVVFQKQVELGQQVSIGTPLFELADVTELRLRVPVAERALSRLRMGQEATVMLRALDDATVGAIVDKIFPSVNPSTGTVTVELRLTATSLNNGTALRPGMYARADIDVRERSDVLVIPAKALIKEGGEDLLFVLDDKVSAPSFSRGVDAKRGADHDAKREASVWRVQRRAVQTGWKGNGLVEITAGLADDERFVVLGQSRLHDGSLVRVVEKHR